MQIDVSNPNVPIFPPMVCTLVLFIDTVLRRRHSEEGDTIKVCGPDSGALQKMGLSDSAPSLSLPFVLFNFNLI